MPLVNILASISSTSGLQLDVTSQRAYLVGEIINQAAKEVYDTYTLRNVNREQIFNCGSDQQQIVLPWYVGKLIAARDYDYRMPNNNLDMRPRYQMSDWSGYACFTWREKQKQYPLKRENLNEGPYTFTFRQSCVEQLTITITGATPNSEKEVEVINFAVGDMVKTSVNSWLTGQTSAIQKSRTTKYNLIITDIEGTEISDIPNGRLEASFSLYQILDRFQLYSPDRLVECLYKLTFIPMDKDTDLFCGCDIYDNAIYHKCLERLWIKSGNTPLATAAFEKCDQLINAIEADYDDGKVHMLDFQPNPVYSAYSNLRYNNTPYNNNNNGNYSYPFFL